MGSFTDLQVFQLALAMVRDVYTLTKGFPGEERFCLSAQLHRAVISIPSCIAESSGRRTARERKHYIDIAVGSLNEVLAQLLIAEELKYVDSSQRIIFEADYRTLRAKLIAFQNSIQSRPQKQTPTSNPQPLTPNF
jgi:four helix bundle protein